MVGCHTCHHNQYVIPEKRYARHEIRYAQQEKLRLEKATDTTTNDHANNVPNVGHGKLIVANCK